MPLRAWRCDSSLAHQMLYTKKGDKGKTGTFACNQRISKSSATTEALGALDETNSFLGICKIKSRDSRFKIHDSGFEDIVNKVQNNLFIIQAEVAGAEKTIAGEKVKEIEKIIDWAEKELPPIKTFFISGATELSALFDTARTIARRAERRVVEVSDSFDEAQDKDGKVKVGENSLAYLNRLSSLLYALARLSAHKSGAKEKSPDYN